LQMVIQTALGFKARSEAVGLARRSIAVNVNLGTATATATTSTTTHLNQRRPDVSILHADFSFCNYKTRQEFDLISGTPPYCSRRLSFAKSGTSHDSPGRHAHCRCVQYSHDVLSLGACRPKSCDLCLGVAVVGMKRSMARACCSYCSCNLVV